MKGGVARLASLKLAPRCSRTTTTFQQSPHYEKLIALPVTLALEPLAVSQPVGRENTPRYPLRTRNTPQTKIWLKPYSGGYAARSNSRRWVTPPPTPRMLEASRARRMDGSFSHCNVCMKRESHPLPHTPRYIDTVDANTAMDSDQLPAPHGSSTIEQSASQ